MGDAGTIRTSNLSFTWITVNTGSSILSNSLNLAVYGNKTWVSKNANGGIYVDKDTGGNEKALYNITGVPEGYTPWIKK